MRSRRGLIRLGATAAAAALIALAAPAVAPAQTFGVFAVDKTADEFDGECTADCTLREAVTLAGQATGGGTPSISVPAGVYRLTLGALQVRTVLILGAGLSGGQGAGARTTIIDARGRSRVVEVAGGSSAILAGLTLRGGGNVTSGGGAFVGAGGVLNLYNAHVVDNVAVTRGGGIHAVGTIGVQNSTVAGNRVTSGSGGGIAADADGDIILLRSTVSGNTATANGGGLTAAGGVSILGSTIARNGAAAGGGIFKESLETSFISMTGSIVAANPTGGACGGTIGTGTSRNFSGNLADDASCAFTGAEGQQNADPRLQPLRNNGGPTDTHALGAGSPAINAGDSQVCTGAGPDQRFAAPVGTCDIGAFEFGGRPPEPQLPPPTAGETVNVSESRGTVRVKLPGSNEFFDLEDAQQVPIGSTFDTSKGRVNLIAAGSQRAWFYKGVFRLGQTKGAKPLSTLTLTGKLNCGGGGKANVAAKKKKKKRRLWGDGKGRFRTKGEFSSATVRGTRWLVEDRCNGTLTRVKKGRVAVRYRGRTINLRAGQQFFAKRRR